MKRILLYILLSIFVLSCGGDDDSPEQIDDILDMVDDNQIGQDDEANEDAQQGQTISISVEGLAPDALNGIDIVTPSDNVILNENLTLEIIGEFDSNEDFPILFVKEDEIQFGFFQSDITDNSLKVKNVLQYFIKTQNEISLLGIDNGIIDEAITDSSEYEKLTDLLLSAMKENLNPIENDEFVLALEELTKDILVNQNNFSGKAKSDSFFKINYDRFGRVFWNEKSPLAAYTGISIENKNSNPPNIQNKVLKPRLEGLDLSTILDIVYGLFDENNQVLDNQFTMVDEGEYEIVYTNGKGLKKLDETVQDVNLKHFASMITSLLGGKVTKSVANSGNSCKDALTKMAIDSYFFGKQKLIENNGVSFDDLIDLGSILVSGFAENIENCPSVNFKKYYKLVFNGNFNRLSARLRALKLIGRTLEIALLGDFIIDFYNSDISGSEKRFYQSGLSVGEISIDVTSETELTILPNTEFEFSSYLTEKVVSYDVIRTIEFESVFVKKEVIQPAEGLFFDFNIISGDVEFKTGQDNAASDENGNYRFLFTSGLQDSRIEIVPSFLNPNLQVFEIDVSVEYEDITLNTDFLDFGDVELNTSKTLSLTLNNPNNLAIEVNFEILDEINAFFLPNESSEFSLSIEAKSSEEIQIVFSPNELGEFIGSIRVANGINQDSTMISLIGEGVSDIDPVLAALFQKGWENDDIDFSCSGNERWFVHHPGFDQWATFHFEEDGTISIDDLGEGDGIYTGGTWSYTNGTLNFSYEYTLQKTRSCQMNNEIINVQEYMTAKTQFTSTSFNSSNLTFMGNYEFDFIFEYSDNDVECFNYNTSSYCTGTSIIEHTDN